MPFGGKVLPLSLLSLFCKLLFISHGISIGPSTTPPAGFPQVCWQRLQVKCLLDWSPYVGTHEVGWGTPKLRVKQTKYHVDHSTCTNSAELGAQDSA